MRSRSVVAALVVLLTVSLLLAFAPVLHGAAAAPSSVRTASTPAPAATVGLTVLNGNDQVTNQFYPGEGVFGTLYFVVTDPLDHAVNVTLTDPNAARDGVPAPAFHYEATLNTSTSTFDSFSAHIGFTFPASLPYGGQWTINVSAPNGGSIQQTIWVYVYYLSVNTSTGIGSTLPGQSISVIWVLFSNANGLSIYTRATSVTIAGSYTGNGTTQTLFPHGPVALAGASTGEGQWTGTVPANATPNSVLNLEIWAVTNVSGQVAENESSNFTISVGTLVIQNFGLNFAPPDCQFTVAVYVTEGSVMSPCVQAGSSYFGSFTPIAGLAVTTGFWNGTAHVTLPGVPTNLRTNQSGEAAFTFTASSPPFALYPAHGSNSVNLTVTVAGATGPYTWTQYLNLSFNVLAGNFAAGLVSDSLSATQYYPGQNATVTWSVSTTNLSATGPISPSIWGVFSESTGAIFAAGLLNTSATGGSFSFPITTAMATQTLAVGVYATNATSEFAAFAYATVLDPSLLLTPGADFYSPGSTATVTAVLNAGSTGAAIDYQVVGQWQSASAILGSGSIASGGTISVPISSSLPPLGLTVFAWATENGQVITSSSVTLQLAEGYSILLGVTTASSYADGSYQPGETVTLSYAVDATSGVALPQVVSFLLYAQGYADAFSIENVVTSGTLSFTIPSNAVQGSLLLVLSAQGALAAGPCLPSGSCVGTTTISINNHPSVLNLELGAGSGLTVAWLILLVLFLIAIILGVVLFLRRRGGRRSSPSMIGPPAPPPSTAPAEQWREPNPPNEPHASPASTPDGNSPSQGSTGNA